MSELYRVQGTFSFYVDVQVDRKPLSEKSTITVNAFSNKQSKIPIPCKYNWSRNGQSFDHQGNIYQCCAQDIGANIEVHITSFEDEYDGKAILQLNPIRISENLEQILSQLLMEGQRLMIMTQDQRGQGMKWEFQNDFISLNGTQQQIRFPQFTIQASLQDVKVALLRGELLQQFNYYEKEAQLKFMNREERDIFIAAFQSLYASKTLQYRTILNSLGQILQKKDSKSLLEWVLSHYLPQQKVFNGSASQINYSQYQSTSSQMRYTTPPPAFDEIQQLRSQNQQFQLTIDTLQQQLRKQCLMQTTQSERILQKNPPAIIKVVSEPVQPKSPSADRDRERRYQEEIDQLQRQLNKLIEASRQSHDQLEYLSRENSELKNKINRETSTKSSILAQSEYTINRTDFTQENKEALEKMIISLQNEIKLQRQKEHKLNKKIQELELELEKLKQFNPNNTLNQSIFRQSMITVDEQQYRALEEKVEEAKKFNDRLKIELERMKSRITILQSENDALKTNNNLMMTNSLQGELISMKQRCLDLEKENRIMKENQITPAKQNFPAQIENINNLNKKLLNENNELQKKVRDLEDEIEMMKNLSQSRIVYENNTEEVFQMKAQNEQLHKENEFIKKQSKQEIEKIKQKIQVLQGENDELKLISEMNSNKNQEIDQMKQKCLKLEKENRLLKESALPGPKVEKNQQVENMISLNKKIMSENVDLTKRIRDLEDELELMKNLSQSRISYGNNNNEQISSLRHQVEQLENENEFLKKKTQMIQDRLKNSQGSDKSEDKSKIIEQQMRQVQEQNKRYLQENMKLFEEIKQLKDQIETYSLKESHIDNSFEIMELRAQVEKLKLENNKLKLENNQLQRQIKTISASTDDSVRQLKTELENEQLKDQLKDLQNKLNQQNKLKSSFKQDSDETQLLQYQIQKLSITNQRLTEQNNQFMEQIKNLQEELINKSLSQSVISKGTDDSHRKGWGM